MSSVKSGNCSARSNRSSRYDVPSPVAIAVPETVPLPAGEAALTGGEYALVEKPLASGVEQSEAPVKLEARTRPTRDRSIKGNSN